MPHISNRPAAEFVPAAEIGMGVVWVIGAIQRWAEPKSPVEVLRHCRGVARQRGILGPHRSHRPIVDLAQLANRAVLDHVQRLLLTGSFAGRKEVGGDLFSTGRFDYGSALE